MCSTRRGRAGVSARILAAASRATHAGADRIEPGCEDRALDEVPVVDDHRVVEAQGRVAPHRGVRVADQVLVARGQSPSWFSRPSASTMSRSPMRKSTRPDRRDRHLRAHAQPWRRRRQRRSDSRPLSASRARRGERLARRPRSYAARATSSPALLSSPWRRADSTATKNSSTPRHPRICRRMRARTAARSACGAVGIPVLDAPAVAVCGWRCPSPRIHT